LGGDGSHALADALLGDADRGHEHERADRQPDPDPACIGVLAAGEVAHRLDGDVGSKDEELDRDETLGAPVRRASKPVVSARLTTDGLSV
jgi:hypothetical protein